jgi:signal transduction histidine kinase
MTSQDSVSERRASGRAPPARRARPPLVHGVARLPWKVRTKLLVAFVGILTLFVLVAALGLRALGQSDARVEGLGTLQLRASAYRELETDSEEVRLLIGPRAGGAGWNVYLGRKPSFEEDGPALALLDQSITATLSSLGQAAAESRLGFIPPPEDEPALDAIRATQRRLTAVMSRISSYDRSGAFANGRELQHRRAEPLANKLSLLSGQLADSARDEAMSLIAQNQSAYAHSRNLVIAVGATSVLLALLLGYVLAGSVVAPIQLTEERLEEIASGDFSKHLDVPNRDELGALTTNVNRMNDELRHLYERLEAQAAELAGWNRTLEARVAEQTQELRASRTRVVLAADAERRRIERDLHDGAQQQLIGLAVQLRLAGELVGTKPEKTKELIDALDDEIETTIDQLRDLAHGIYPPLLQDRGLADALAAAALRSSITAQVDTHDLGRYSPDIESTVYFCCVEALQNAAKHAGADALVTISVRANGHLTFRITDDGVGFEPRSRHDGVGLTNMRDRVGALGGSLDVRSTPGGGVTVTGSIPLER